MKYCPTCTAELITKEVDNETRLACSENNCNFVFWDNPVPVVAALIELEGVYVIARNSLWPTGMFSLIAGYLERGETVEQAVLRELDEELGLTGSELCHIGNYSFFEKNQIIFAYLVRASGNLHLNDEIAEVKLLSKIELQEYNFSSLELTERIIADWKLL